jgi:uncharacterized protein (TIGR03435 family)
MLRFAAVLAGLLAGATALTASPSPQGPAFEVASLRLSPSTQPYRPFLLRFTDTRVDIENVSLLAVLRTAFRLKEYQLVAPDGLGELRVHVHATLPPGSRREQAPEMLRQLLVERFRIVEHRELRPRDGYDLLVGSGGIKMSASKPADELGEAFRDPAVTSLPSDAVSETVEGPVRTIISPTFGYRTVTRRTMFDRKLTDRLTVLIDATRMTMAELAQVLETTIDRPVVDKTGLTGVYQFRLELPHDASVVEALLAKGRTTTPNGSPLIVPGSWSEVVEGLGLKLEKRRIPIEFVVIDRIERTPLED